jgi:DNA-binding MarR family transcriptional regulator
VDRLRPGGARDRHYTDDDVDRMRRLRVLLAADLPPTLATRAVDGDLGEDERARARRALAALVEQAREADADLARGGAVAAPAEAPPEHRISLMFDTWIMRTRMECVLGSALRPAGVPVGEYAVISLISVGGPLTPASLARLVGTAPTTLGSRLSSLSRRGWIRRRPDPTDRRSWLIELTPEGADRLRAAIPHAAECRRRIDRALEEQGTPPDAVRAALVTLSAALRTLIPDAGP